jgi:hypothetical protein
MRGLKGAHWITSDERLRCSPQICCCYSAHQEPKSCEAIGPALILALQHTKLVSSTGGEQETLLPWPPTTSSGTCREKPSPMLFHVHTSNELFLGNLTTWFYVDRCCRRDTDGRKERRGQEQADLRLARSTWNTIPRQQVERLVQEQIKGKPARIMQLSQGIRRKGAAVHETWTVTKHWRVACMVVLSWWGNK